MSTDCGPVLERANRVTVKIVNWSEPGETRVWCCNLRASLTVSLNPLMHVCFWPPISERLLYGLCFGRFISVALELLLKAL